MNYERNLKHYIIFQIFNSMNYRKFVLKEESNLRNHIRPSLSSQEEDTVILLAETRNYERNETQIMSLSDILTHDSRDIVMSETPASHLLRP